MANVFLNLPAPAGNGAGAAVDTSTLGKDRTITVQGTFRGTVNIEFSNEGAGGPWAQLTTFVQSGKVTVPVAARFMRVVRSGVPSISPGTPNVDVGSNDTGGLFVALPAPAGNGTGAAVDVSTLGTFNTVTCLDSFRGTTIIEISEDNVNWAQCMVFTPGGPGFQSKDFVAQFMRVRRVGVPDTNPGTPNVDVGAVNDFGAGGGNAGGFVTALYVENPATGDEGPAFYVTEELQLSELRAVIVGGASPSVTWTIRFDADRSAVGTEVVTGGTVTTNTTIGQSVTVFNNGTIPAGRWVWIELTSVTTGANTPDSFTVAII